MDDNIARIEVEVLDKRVERITQLMAAAEVRLSRLQSYARERPDDATVALLVETSAFSAAQIRECRDRVVTSVGLLREAIRSRDS
jgi:hypothetical protein